MLCTKINGRQFKECMPVRSYRGGIVWDRYRRRLVFGNYTVTHTKEWFECIKPLANIWRNCIPLCTNYVGFTKCFPAAVSIGEGLPFTTSSINHTFETHFHYDENNVTGTFAFCICLRKKVVSGGELILPELGFGVDWQSGGVVLCPFHLVMHGNKKIFGNGNFDDRVTMINYVNKFVFF